MKKIFARTVIASSCALSLAAFSIACDPPPPKAPQQEMVPANSGSEATTSAQTSATPASSSSANAGSANANGAGGGAAPATSGSASANSMPTPIGGPAASTDESAPPMMPAPPTIKSGKGPKATKAECGKALDKYIDLAIGGDPRLSGVSKDMIKQAFTQASAQQGNPCDGDGLSKTEYKCAMKATSTDEWQKCMK